MRSMILRKIARDSARSIMRTDDYTVASDEYMTARGFTELTREESRKYSRFFDCADRPSHGATADSHLEAFLLRAKRLFHGAR
jgi:hypothetical protein